MANKITKVEMFSQILAHLTDPQEIEFIQNEIELTKRKNAKRSTAPTKAQKENASYGEQVLACMAEGERYTVTEIQAKVASMKELSNQRATAIMRALVKAGSVVRVEEKGKAYFTLA
jgi:thiamine pyrophosphokinase